MLTVMDHFHVVSGTGLADPITTRLAVNLCGGFLEDLLNVWPCSGGTTGHERGTIAGTLLTTRNTRADEEKTLGLKLLRAADRIGVMRVAAVNDDVTRFKFGHELVNERINGSTGLNKEDNLARRLEL